jgi:hypothetical protein
VIRFSGLERKELAASIKQDIDDACVRLFDQSYRDHLGASVIGQECNRRIVYGFRWMHREQFDGRMLRLFNRGHLEELRIANWLKAASIAVFGVSQDGEQIRISANEQHYGGSLDGVGKLPPKYQIEIPFLLEMKTHNDKRFKQLVKNGVRIAKPEHFIQMSCYAQMYELQYGIYFGINKNDDDIHVEVLEMDWQLGINHTEKARNDIYATQLPSRIAANPAYGTCKYCPMVGVCHLGHSVDINCRSCINSVPINDQQWFCKHWNATIPKEAIPQACGEWSEFR